MEDRVQVTAGQRRGAVCDVGAGTDQLDLRMAGKRFAELVEPFTGSGGVNTHALGCLVSGAHYGLLPGPSKYILSTSRIVLPLSTAFTGCRSDRCQTPLFSIQNSFLVSTFVT